MKNRILQNQLIDKHSSRIGRILVLTGARQTGKTTLLRNSFKDYSWILMDDPVLRIQYASLTAQQWYSAYPAAILDEIQKIPSLVETVKAIYDTYEDSKYILSGSSQLLLMEKIRESLAGRCHKMELFPLTLPEMLTSGWDDPIIYSFFQRMLTGDETPESLHPSALLMADHAKRYEVLQYYLKFGGYPALVNERLNDTERYEWLKGYIKTYLERDIRDLADFRDLEPFVRTQQMTALNTAQLLNYTNLSRDAGITPATAKRFIQYLEISYQVILLQPWFKNKLKRLVKSPKLHYLDIGVQHAILQKQGGLTGSEFESAIIAELYKQANSLSLSSQFYHLQTFDGKEVDLVIETERGYYAFEMKMTKNVTSHDSRHLTRLSEILDKPLLYSFVLSNDPVVKNLGQNIVAIPAVMFLT